MEIGSCAVHKTINHVQLKKAYLSIPRRYNMADPSVIYSEVSTPIFSLGPIKIMLVYPLNLWSRLRCGQYLERNPYLSWKTSVHHKQPLTSTFFHLYKPRRAWGSVSGQHLVEGWGGWVRTMTDFQVTKPDFFLSVEWLKLLSVFGGNMLTLGFARVHGFGGQSSLKFQNSMYRKIDWIESLRGGGGWGVTIYCERPFRGEYHLQGDYTLWLKYRNSKLQ